MKLKKKDWKIKNSDRLSSYFSAEIPSLVVVTLTGIVYNVGMIAGPYFEGRMVQCLYDILNGKRTVRDMEYLAVLYISVILLVQIMRAAKRFFVRHFANGTARSMRRVLYNNLVWKNKTELENTSIGSIMTRAVSDVDACAEGMRKFTTELFDTGVLLIAYLTMLFRYDIRLTFLSVIFMPAAYFIAGRLKKTIWKYGTAFKESAGSLNNATMDRITAAVTYRVFGREKNRFEAYEQNLSDYEKKAVRANVWENTLQPLYQVISMTGVIFIILFGARNMSGNGWTAWDLAAFTTYLSCFTKLAQKSSHAAKLFNSVQKAQVSWKRIKPLMKEYREADTATDIDFSKENALTVSGLSFAYPGFPPLIKDLSFKAAKGEIIGITGPVASGKSAFGKLFLGEYPYSGSIRIGSHELRTLTPYERTRLITYQGHDPELLSDTLKENICLGDGTDPVPFVNAVCLDQDLSEMPEGILTDIGSSGSRLSGGQKARTALARALCHANNILILDDPFSAVDRATESEIMRHLRSLSQDRIVLLISHRLSCFPEFDRVVWIGKDRTGTGSHLDMMKNNEEYRKLFELQKTGAEKDEA